MAAIPGPKTNPSVMQLASTNQRNLRDRRISLGPLQIAALIGLFTGCLAVSFYLGFFSGQKFGIDTAMNNNLSTAMRLPIEPAQEQPKPQLESDEAAVSDIYAKLNGAQKNKPLAAPAQERKAPQMPELGSIQDLGSAPIFPESASPGIEVRAEPQIPNVKVLGGKSADLNGGNTSDGKTLGELVRGDSKSAVAATPAAKPEPTVEQVPTAPPAATKAAEQGAKDKPATRVPPREESLIRNVVPKGWFAQIAAPKSQGEAEAIARKLKASGFQVVIENALVRGQNYYRILVGPEEDRIHAERLIAQLKREPYIKSEPFLRMVR